MYEWSSSLIPSVSRPDVLEIEALRTAKGVSWQTSLLAVKWFIYLA
ncbi:hypothetical protein NDI44_28375 [Trichocoleus sp. DQ-A3]|nr:MULTISPECIES: hypothetical protein [unclassified Coleofasciculus]MBD1893006.1 hypothetical protein [Coleofasciculus sp. FACHB-SPT9]MBD1903694.1 hypothetical protein [Coleofasciculus sp. FACHB-125]